MAMLDSLSGLSNALGHLPPVKNTPCKKGKNVKKEIKKEIKQEIKPEPPCNPTPASKRPRAISAEMTIRKRNWRKELEALGP